MIQRPKAAESAQQQGLMPAGEMMSTGDLP
jgi:hypothetical protein